MSASAHGNTDRGGRKNIHFYGNNKKEIEREKKSKKEERNSKFLGKLKH